jgi:hypothetical protein
MLRAPYRRGKLRPSTVTQIVNLPYRRLAVGGASVQPCACHLRTPRGLPIRDTAGCQPALPISRPAIQQAGTLRDGWQRLDESLHEDKSRVRLVSGVAVLGVLSRISLALFQADCQRPQPVRDKTYPVWSGRLQQQPRPMLDRLLKSCLSP